MRPVELGPGMQARVVVWREGTRDWRFLWLRRRGRWATYYAGVVTGASWNSDGSASFHFESAMRFLQRRAA